ncbi:MAG: type II toxin-antitoxin system VapC family toxin [Bacteroidota bacterium]
MKYLLDTNICIYIIKKQYPEVLSKLTSVGFSKISISTITIAELEYGVANSQKSMEAQTALLEFLMPFDTLDFNSAAASYYGRIRKELKDKATPISDMDMLIAAIAMANELTLVTNNEKEFKRISGLKVENWKSKSG